jgi:hypothetical protein
MPLNKRFDLYSTAKIGTKQGVFNQLNLKKKERTAL